MAPELQVPVEFADLSPDWVGAALVEGGRPGCEVAAIATEPVGEIGNIGALHRLHLTYTDGSAEGPSTMIAKMPTTEPGGRAIGTMMGMYEKESGFYRHLYLECPIPTATCFYNGADTEAGRWCLLLEDLGGLTPGDQLTARSAEETRSDLTAMAQLHATWADGRADGHEWLPLLADSAMTQILDAFDTAHPAAMEVLGDIIPPHMHDWAPRFAPTARDWVADFCAQPTTIVHGDYRTDNFMFGADGTFTLIDWQLLSRAPGAYDVYYYLSQCTDPDVLNADVDGFLDHYLAAYEAAGAQPADRETLLHQMRGVALWLMCFSTVTAAAMEPSNERAFELFLSQRQRGLRLAETIDAARALD